MRQRRAQGRKDSAAGYPYTWTRSTMPKGRKGQRCRKTGKRHPGNVVGVQFQDGAVFMVAEGGLQRG